MSQTASSPSESRAQRRGTLCSVQERLERMLESGDSADVQFSVGRHYGPAKIFRGHKCVLSSGSDVFYTMFNGSLPEKCDGPVDIPDILPEAFDNMLRYIYADEVNVTAKDAYPTLKCADKYDLPELADSSLICIIDDLGAENRDANHYLQHLENALTWAVGIEGVVENCLHFVDVHCAEIFQSERFTELQPKTLQMILERDTLFVEENSVYMAVNRWVSAFCTRSNLEPTPKNRRLVLGDMFFLIRFPLMTDTQLADGPLNDLLLLPQDLTEIYFYKHATTKRPLSFPTQLRRPPAIHAGDAEFRHKEEIFVEDSFSSSWHPALVIGAHGSKIMCESLKYAERCVEKQELAKIIRASTFLVADQDILYRSRIGYVHKTNAQYTRLEEGSHMITINGEEQQAEFCQMSLEHFHVDAWRQAKRASTRKRPLDAADRA
ncbi:BTB/POZ domain-containing protein 6-like [Paramacrobiotus metropolitanus]|uniref:BTB/POZ domain-containing protein 6-like n=1 Tax=Paramacrobiotus metropolitanus TaxID=2943436 RepID=UPI002446132C|nr:BTB/POZ domain-containing protein 6-like [Paramacrobiotus metropolitanus]